MTSLLLKIGLEQNKPYAANRVQEQLSKMFNLAIRWNLLPEDFDNPAQEIEGFHETPRDRFLSSAEQARVLASIEQEQSEFVRSAFKLLMLTTLRMNEILTLTWSNVDLSTTTITIRDSKNGTNLFQPLNKQAVGVLSELARVGPFVIAGGGGRCDKPALS